MNTTTAQLYRIAKLIKGINVPYYNIGPDGNNRTLFQYPNGYKEFLEQRFNELWEQWRQQHPYAVLNGRKNNDR